MNCYTYQIYITLRYVYFSSSSSEVSFDRFVVGKLGEEIPFICKSCLCVNLYQFY